MRQRLGGMHDELVAKAGMTGGEATAFLLGAETGLLNTSRHTLDTVAVAVAIAISRHRAEEHDGDPPVGGRTFADKLEFWQGLHEATFPPWDEMPEPDLTNPAYGWLKAPTMREWTGPRKRTKPLGEDDGKG